MGVGHPLSGANGIALDQTVDDLGTAGERGAVDHWESLVITFALHLSYTPCIVNTNALHFIHEN